MENDKATKQALMEQNIAVIDFDNNRDHKRETQRSVGRSSSNDSTSNPKQQMRVLINNNHD